MSVKSFLPWVVVLLLALAAVGVRAWWLDTSARQAAEKAQQAAEEAADKGEQAAAAETAGFVGSSQCRSCHEEFYAKWSNSWHGLAMQPYTAGFARENLVRPCPEMAIGGKTYLAQTSGAHDAVIEKGADGTKTRPIVQVMGGKNVFFLLTPFRGGRLQVLPLAFDTRKKEWYDTTGSMVRHVNNRRDEALDWTERQLTFNASCHGCHVSQLAKNYSLETDTYHTTWREPGINCESCHGPGQRHIEKMAGRDKRGGKGDRHLLPEPGTDRRLVAGGFAQKVPAPFSPAPADLAIVVTGTMDRSQMNALCAQCHAKLTPLTAGFQPGDQFFDHFRLGTLEDADFYPDGRDLGENFTYTQWLMSPCAGSGKLDCMHCHTSSGRNRHAPAGGKLPPDRSAGSLPAAIADQACAPCHQQHVDAPAAHSHHPAANEGSRCVACHMPETTFARMRRHDHTMLPPAPAATLRFQSPNACNICHTDHDARWADEWVRKWYPRDYQAPLVRRGELIQAARKGDWVKLDEMLAYVTGEGGRVGRSAAESHQAEKTGGSLPPAARNEVFAASLLRLLAAAPDAKKWPAYLKAAKDLSPLVRSSAVGGLAACPEPEAVQALTTAASDPCRLVRLEAAAALSHARSLAVRAAHEGGPRPPPVPAAVQKVWEEYETSLRGRPDDPLSHYNLGNHYQDQGDPTAAIGEYDIALRLDPTLVPALVNLSMVYAGMEQPAKAEKALRQALRQAPANAEANFNLGLLLGEQGRRGEAITCLRAALKADLRNAVAAYNLAVLVAENDLKEAIGLLRQAAELRPDDPKYAYSLAFYLNRNGDRAGAVTVLKRLLQRHPDYAAATEMLRELQK